MAVSILWCAPRQSELMFDAFKAAGGDIRLWIYQGLQHDCWTRAFDEPDLPRWLLSHRTPAARRGLCRADCDSHCPVRHQVVCRAARQPGRRLPRTQWQGVTTIFRQGEQLFEKAPAARLLSWRRSRPTRSSPRREERRQLHLTFERDAQGRVTGYLYRDNRHEERWIRIVPGQAR